MYDFEVVSSEVDISDLNTSLALRCQWELPNVGRFTRACISPNGNSPVICTFPETEGINVVIRLTRGWGSGRDVETSAQGDIRIHYVWRRDQTPEEGYFSCHNYGSDTNNDPAGLYILYPSEWPSLMTVREMFCILSFLFSSSHSSNCSY